MNKLSISVIEKNTDKFAADHEKKIYKLKLLIEGETANFLNVLRRIIDEEVKTLAIDDVYVYENNSAMWDEFIAHRLGLIVLNTPLDYSYDKTVEIELEKKGKGYVYASDLRIKDNKVYAVYPETIIAYLEENQEIKMKMIARFGSGKEHTKWKPGLVYYYRLANIKLKDKLDEKDIEILKSLGVKVKGDNLVIPQEKIYDRTFIDAIQSVNKEKIDVIPEDKFIFVVESYGFYSAEQIISLGINEMKRKIKNLINEFMK